MFLFGLSPLVYAAVMGEMVLKALRSGQAEWPRKWRSPLKLTRSRQPVRFWIIVAANTLMTLFFALTPLGHQATTGF